MWTNMLGSNHASHQKNWRTKVWAQILMALPYIAMNCNPHHKPMVIMWRHAAKHFSHTWTLQTCVLNFLMHMEYVRSPIPYHGQHDSINLTSQKQWSPSTHHAQLLHKLRVWCKDLSKSVVYTFVFLPVEPTWACHCYVHVSQANNPSKQRT